MSSVCVLALVATAAPWANAAACEPSYFQVAVYRDADFQGSCAILGIGEYSNGDLMRVGNDSISSLIVGSGVRTTLYEHNDFGGQQAFYEGGYRISNVGQVVNDKTSSMVVMPRWGTEAAFWYLGNNPTWSLDEGNGLASSDDDWFLTTSGEIFGFPIDSLYYTRRVGMPAPLSALGCNHFGDPDVINGYLFVPVENCSGGPMVAVFTSNLDYVCADYLYFQAEASWLAYDPATNHLVSSRGVINSEQGLMTYTIDWNGIYFGSMEWFLWDGDHFPLLRDRHGVPLSYSWPQGGDFNEDGTLLYLSNGGPACAGGDTGIRIIDTYDYTQAAHSGNRYGPFDYEHSCSVTDSEEAEGLDYREMTGPGTVFEGALHGMVLDNDYFTDEIYIKHYRK